LLPSLKKLNQENYSHVVENVSSELSLPVNFETLEQSTPEDVLLQEETVTVLSTDPLTNSFSGDCCPS
jgi:hypothetical protein